MLRIRTKYLECGSAAAAFVSKAAAALPHSKFSVDIVTVLPVLRQIQMGNKLHRQFIVDLAG
jgi:hypothetical protein